VLIVEDESRLREMLHRAVREMGFNPTVSNTAESALREAENRAFDIAIVDLNLPGMGGLEMLEAVAVDPGVEFGGVLVGQAEQLVPVPGVVVEDGVGRRGRRASGRRGRGDSVRGFGSPARVEPSTSPSRCAQQLGRAV